MHKFNIIPQLLKYQFMGMPWYNSGLKKFGARLCRAPNVHQTSIGGARNIVHQHYFSW